MPVSEDVFPPIQTRPGRIGLDLYATLPSSGGVAPSLQQVVDAPDPALRLYAVDVRGQILVIDAGTVRTAPFLDLRTRSDFDAPNGQAGLRSLAFHPDFGDASAPGYGRVYTVHTAPVASRPTGIKVFSADPSPSAPLFDSVVAEWRLLDPTQPLRVDPASKRELFRIEQYYADHNANQLLFDPNATRGSSNYGKLYVSVADGGNPTTAVAPALDPANWAQRTDLVYGKILRIDPLAASGGAAYRVPSDNPFVGTAGTLPELWALGLRNPQTLAFDRAGTRALLLGDIGEDHVEEINVGRAGANYGWNLREGPLLYNGGDVQAPPAGDTGAPFHSPITGYDHEEIGGNAGIAFGAVYRGAALTGLQGHAIFANFPDGRLYAADMRTLATALGDGRISSQEFVQPQRLSVEVDGSPTTLAALLGNARGRVDARLAQDATGELYVFGKHNGRIYKLVEPDAGAVVTMVTNGSARSLGANEYLLTPASARQSGTIQSAERLDLRKDFTITADLYLGSNDGGADGVAFVLHAAPAGSTAVGLAGGANLGVRGIANGLGIEFDTYRNGTSDLAADHTQLFDTDGSFQTAAVALPNLEDGAWHRLVVTWSAATQTLSYGLDGVARGKLTDGLVTTFFGGSPLVHFGFGGATGGTFNEQKVRLVDVATAPPASGGGLPTMVTNGSARSLGDKEYQLTAASARQSGTIQSEARLDLRSDFKVTADLYLGTNDAGADGMAFVLHADGRGSKAIGAAGGANLAVRGIANGLGLEFDTYRNSTAEPAADHTQIFDTDGTFASSAVALPNLEDGLWHRLVVSWSAATSNLRYELDAIERGSLTGNLAATYFGGANFVHFGFGAATGGTFNEHKVSLVDVVGVFDGGGVV